MWRIGLLLAVGLLLISLLRRRRDAVATPPASTVRRPPPLPALPLPISLQRSKRSVDTTGVGPSDPDIRLTANLQNVLRMVLDACSLADRAVLLTHDPAREAIALRAARDRAGAIDAASDYTIPMGEGLLGWIARERRTVSIADLNRQQAKIAYHDNATPIVSFLSVPLIDGDQYAGMLCVDAATVAAFDEADEAKLLPLADEIVTLLRYDAEQRRMDRVNDVYATLLEISRNLALRVDLVHRLETTVRLAKKIVDYDVCYVFLVETGGRRAVLKVAQDHRSDPIDLTEDQGAVALTDGMLTTLVRTRQPILFSNPAAAGRPDPRIFPSGCTLETTARSFLGLPMMLEERVGAVVLIGSYRERAYTTEDKQLLSIVCYQAALSIAESEMHDRLERLAVTDGLTGLMNHRKFQERLAEEFLRASRHKTAISLLLGDIDYFKQVNDTYGHPAGDAVLKAVAETLTKAARKIDLVARYGGEEFAVLLAQTDGAQAAVFAERIRKAVAEMKVVWQRGTIAVTISIGIATNMEDADNRERLIAAADRALYAAKHGGRNRAVCHDDLIARETDTDAAAHRVLRT